MRCACIDIGSNTTRVLVADVAGGHLREVFAERAFTRLGRELRRTGALPLGAVELVAAVVAEQLSSARNAGAERIRVVATAAIRQAVNGGELCRTVRERTGTGVEVLTGDAEARLAFAGAVRTHAGPLPGRIAVVDVGGGSCEVAIGTKAGGVQWSASLPVGSGSLAETSLRSDPPTAAELRSVLEQAVAAFAVLGDLPPVDHAIAVGGSATSTARIVGASIDAARVALAMERLCAAPAVEVAREHGLDPERVRLLPAGLQLLEAASGRLGVPLSVGRGGIREGTCLELAG
ncbi:MAG: exopolyphosphatase / guanosine-5-triphosphate,3-diphosphate pyrophosphatase [Solirubrobacteraceae bacterium]|jgi:exopolyphosphatase/guanosine-5'-triphosphate,3'-diphosphate pyrophosphatase|nr:exopolyphosphatase / guanosine-5-triphosphate,3-diphosphate pyrophosphatase [Solirubrobacteraceae bacterium]